MGTSWAKDPVLKSHTIGNSEACRVLAKMMNENIILKNDKHKVLSFIHSASIIFKDASKTNSRSVDRLMVLIRDDFLDRVNQMPYPIIFLTHLKNVITYIYRKNLGEVT